MSKFEYKVLTNDYILSSSDLNEFGVDGWELIAVIFNSKENIYYYHFKREL